MQLGKERGSEVDAQFELDQAFLLFCPDENGMIDQLELRRIFTARSSGSALSDEEFDALLERIGVGDDGKVSVEQLRRHPAFQTL